jgi:hypothetical protein
MVADIASNAQKHGSAGIRIPTSSAPIAPPMIDSGAARLPRFPNRVRVPIVPAGAAALVTI